MYVDTNMDNKVFVCLVLIFAYFPSPTLTEQTCDPCSGALQPFGPWGAWSDCTAKYGDPCNKVQTRKRSRGFFVCKECRDEYQEQSCNVCQHVCQNGVCKCNSGYKLNQDQLTCSDINECDINNGGCEQICNNDVGSVSCSCRSGHIKSTTDSKKCSILSCSQLTSGVCPSKSYKDNAGDACKNVIKSCSNGNFFDSKCNLQCPNGYGLAVIPKMTNRLYFAEFVNESDFSSVKNAASCVVDSNNNVAWNVDILKYFCRRLNDAPRNLDLSKEQIDEQLPVNSIVGTITSFDESRNITYSIEPSEGSTSFNINNGQLRTSKTFKWKDLTKNTIVVTIKAMETTSPYYYTTKSFEIEIMNVNEAPTEIKLSNKKFNDLTSVGDVIGSLTAMDYDVKPPKRTDRYKWTLVSNSPNFKIVGSSLILDKLFSNKNEDFFDVITVQCAEDGPNGKSSQESFTVFHDNTNHPVTMEISDMKPIPESTPVNTKVGKIVIVDSEMDSINISDRSASNVKSKFKFGDLQCVKVNGKTNCSSDIILISSLDYENETEYKISVEAIDEHNEKALLDFKVKVADVNEPPTMISFKDQLTVLEGGAKGLLVGTIKVDDPDSNTKKCEIKNNQSPFEINGFSIVVKDDSLDFEKVNKYSIVVECEDDGKLKIEKQAQIFVIDVNEVPGHPCPSTININHLTAIGTEVHTLDAVDMDNEGYNKQTISFEMAEPNYSSFKIESGKILINETLQSSRLYSFGVKVSDDGSLMEHIDNGGLRKYTGTQNEKIYQCSFQTDDVSPCDKYHVYQNGLCQCKKPFTGQKCDRDSTRCQLTVCPASSICSRFALSPSVCIARQNQVSMLLSVSSNKFVDQDFRNKLEEYIKSILEENRNGNLESITGSTRKRRLSSKESYYVEIGVQLSIKSVYTLVRFLPYKDTYSNGSYSLVDNSKLCSKFAGTDVRCLNAQDCEILKSAGISCSPEDGKQTNVIVVNGDEDTSSPSLYTYLVPIAVAVLIVIIILFLLWRRRNRPIKEHFPEDPVVFNNHTNNLDYSATLPRKPLNTENGERGQTMRDIERNQQVTDVNRFDSPVFQGHERRDANNPGYGRTIDPSQVNYRENLAYIEDKTLEVPSVGNPLYASIGKSAHNPLYQSSQKDKNPEGPKVVDLCTEEEQRAKEKGYSFINEVNDPVLQQARMEANLNLNVYDPKDDEDKEKIFKKSNIGEED